MEREPDESDDAERLFSATTRKDFSKTFHNLMVLSVFANEIHEAGQINHGGISERDRLRKNGKKDLPFVDRRK